MKILVLDDQRSARRVLRQILSHEDGLVVLEASSATEARQLIDREAPELLLLDVRLSEDVRDRGGIELLTAIRGTGVATPAIMVTVHSEFAEIRAAMRAGAQDYILKDELSEDVVLPIIRVYQAHARARRDLQALRTRLQGEQGAESILGRSEAMVRVRELVTRVADRSATVLITGPTGTGKERVARALHAESHRQAEPFVAVNCASLPGPLTESMLFGHERGAFTGADRRYRGAFEAAGGGTLFLDEIGEMAPELQSKLLRVLEEKAVQPLGAQRTVRANARVVAATNADLETRVADGKFRADLFYRLNVVRIDLPLLADRRDDIPELVLHFIASADRRLTLTQGAIDWFVQQPWPGNVRELKNATERVLALHDGDVLDVDALEILHSQHPRELDRRRRLARPINELLALVRDTEGSKLREVERAILHHAIEVCGGNKSGAARLLGTPRTSLERKLERLQRGDGDDDDERQAS
jgi:DNA-binding NtrC family response regulator